MNFFTTPKALTGKIRCIELENANSERIRPRLSVSHYSLTGQQLEVRETVQALVADRIAPRAVAKTLIDEGGSENARTEGEPTETGLQGELDAFADLWDATPIADGLRAFFETRSREPTVGNRNPMRSTE